MRQLSLPQKVSENKNLLIILALIILILLGVYLIFSKRLFTKPSSNTATTGKHYAKLDKNLNEVVNARDPETKARSLGLYLNKTHDKLAVLVTVNNDSFVFSATYGDQKMRYGRYIQGFIKLNKLETLAENPKVKFVTAPLAPKKITLPSPAVSSSTPSAKEKPWPITPVVKKK